MKFMMLLIFWLFAMGVNASVMTGAPYQVVRVPSSGGIPRPGAVDLSQSAATTNALLISRGGTNNASLSVTGGSIPYMDGSKIVSLANGTSGQFLQSAGGTNPPQWFSISPQTQQQFSSTGTTTGQIFTITSGNATVGATYTNNGSTFTVLATIASKTTVFMSGSGSPTSSGTLTKSAGTGDTSLTFSSAQPLATYTTPTHAKALKIYLVGGGGGGGGVATGSGNAAGGGGGGGGGCITIISNPSASYYYAIAPGGTAGASGNNNGASGGATFFLDNFASPSQASGGTGGGGGGAGTGQGLSGGGGTQGNGSNCTINLRGQPAGLGVNYGSFSAVSGYGGGGAIFGSNEPGTINGSVTGPDGYAPGGGGVGACQVNNGGSKAGGTGANGFIFVEEFY